MYKKEPSYQMKNVKLLSNVKSETLFYPKCCFCLLILLCCSTNIALGLDSNEVFINKWAVEIEGGNAVADEVATTHGFINEGQILEGLNFYRFSHPRLKKRSLEANEFHHTKLSSHVNVKWAEQQKSKLRTKRDLLTFNPDEGPNDPRWAQMWYLAPSKQPSMRVVEAWEAGYSGKGVAVTILDDGIEYNHPDLQPNYDAQASYDINSQDDDPMPRYNPSNENRHGTRCAGEVAAVADNGICSIGVAFNAGIGGVRMLDGRVTDDVEAQSIGLKPQHIDIYSASWGPDDDGRTVDGPAKLAKIAFENGVRVGRGGKGSIFVWASGNGGRNQDSCNCDGYTNSIYTLSISSTTESKNKPWYSESCSSTLAATYSSGALGEKQIVTTDLRKSCTNTHTGTSASAPLAAGLCALALEANGNLTWRDMQHLVVRSANPNGLQASDWVTNGVNRKVSHAFGYGLMDAYEMVKQAEKWTLVPKQRSCRIKVIASSEDPRRFSSTEPLSIPVQASACDDGSMMLERLEHVQAVLSLRNQRRGDLAIFLTSPQGTKSQLLGNRRNDMTDRGFDRWPFMTTHSWDEDPRGRWLLEIHDRSSNPAYQGTLTAFDLVLYGTTKVDWEPEPVTTTTTTTKRTSTSTTSTSRAPTTTTTSSQPPIPKIPDVVTKQHPTPAHIQHPTQTPGNCKRPLASGNGCLVCAKPYLLNPITHTCVLSCDPGHYVAYERVDDTLEKTVEVHLRQSSKENRFEESEEETFENQERFDGLVCRPCSSNCHKCNGATNKDCVQCVSGAHMRTSDSSCILVPTVTSPSAYPRTRLAFMLGVLITLVAAAGFIIFYLVTRRSSPRSPCFSGSTSQYKYVPSGDGRMYSDFDTEYHDDDDERPTRNGYTPTLPVIGNGKISNGTATTTNGITPLLTLPSDDERV